MVLLKSPSIRNKIYIDKLFKYMPCGDGIVDTTWLDDGYTTQNKYKKLGTNNVKKLLE